MTDAWHERAGSGMLACGTAGNRREAEARLDAPRRRFADTYTGRTPGTLSHVGDAAALVADERATLDRTRIDTSAELAGKVADLAGNVMLVHQRRTSWDARVSRLPGLRQLEAYGGP